MAWGVGVEVGVVYGKRKCVKNNEKVGSYQVLNLP